VGGGIVTNALATIVPQVAALLLLTPSQYATFSLVFIALGLTYSAQLSLVIDPWLREGAPARSAPTGPLLWAALVLAVAGACIPLALGYVDPAGAVLTVVGVVACQVRNGLRLIQVAVGQWRRAAVADLLLLCGFGLGLALLWGSTAWTVVWLPLALGSLLATVPWARSLYPRGQHTWRWFRDRRRTLAGLWAESSALDLGVALPPIALAQLMPPTQFAVVRAATSALLPVRLVLNPLRSWIGLQDHAVAGSRRFVLGTALGGALIGAAIWLGLALVDAWSIAPDSVLPALAPYAPLVAAMATFQFMSNCVYILARAHVPPRTLFRARLLDTLVQVLAVLGGYAVAGLDGAMVGYVVLSASSYAIWLGVTRSSLGAHHRAP
jgi:hypothetical protein